MRIIKVSATESTNSLARDLYQANKTQTPFCVIADHQIAGRGQRGSSWVSNAGENLTMSIVYADPMVKIGNQFVLSATVALAVFEALNSLKIINLKLKWPNDIMAANYKIAGILIENIVNNGRIKASIFGLGLNINQLEFKGLPKAASLRMIMGKEYDIYNLAEIITASIIKRLDDLNYVTEIDILKDYENNLFRKDKVSTFLLPGGEFLTGVIKGTSSTGLLKVMVEDEAIKLFDLKEIKLLF